jgi:hypothetical protein
MHTISLRLIYDWMHEGLINEETYRTDAIHTVGMLMVIVTLCSHESAIIDDRCGQHNLSPRLLYSIVPALIVVQYSLSGLWQHFRHY